MAAMRAPPLAGRGPATPTALVTTARRAPPPFLSEGAGGVGVRIGATNAAAQAQKEEYFAMCPWEQPTKIELGGRPTTLDLRAFTQPFNRSCAVTTPVYAAQDGLTRKAYPGARGLPAPIGWRPIGFVSALDQARRDLTELVQGSTGAEHRALDTLPCPLVAGVAAPRHRAPARTNRRVVRRVRARLPDRLEGRPSRAGRAAGTQLRFESGCMP